MAKVAKPKKREPTIHSRAHRRNASPPPKDLAVKAPTSTAEEETDYKPWLHSAQNAGVSKKKKKKQMSRQQKARQAKAMEKADANMDKLATKVKDSKARGRRVQARRAEWEELNGDAKGVEGRVNEENAGKGGQKEELDVGMGEAEAEQDGEAEGERKELAAEAVTLPEPEEDEEL